MNDTPRTDAIAHRGYNESAYISEMTGLSRQLERENQTFRAAQKACEDCDAPRVDRIAELERELDFSEQTGRQIWQANERLKAELAAERELADRLGTWVRALYRDKKVPTFCEESVHRAINTWEDARRE